MSISHHFAPGDRWTYDTPEGFDASRIIIGAVLSFADRERIVCCAVTGAPRRMPDGRIEPVTIPFLPMSETALASSVSARDGQGELPPGFAGAFEAWQADPRGLSLFTVPFRGRLDELIARQLAGLSGAAQSQSSAAHA